MWYLNLMQPLLAKVKDKDSKQAKVFLSFLFRFLKTSIYEEEAPPFGMFLAVIEKAYATFENKEDGSLSLKEFTQPIFLWTLIFTKTYDEHSVWNSDFVPIYQTLESFLGWRKQVSKLENDLATNKINFNSNVLGTTQEKAINYLLNELEAKVLFDLDFKVDINLFSIETIFARYGANEVQAFTEEALKLQAGGSPEFSEILAYIYMPNLIKKIQSFSQLLGKLELDSELTREFSKLSSKLQSEWQIIEKELGQTNPDPQQIEGMKEQFRSLLQEVEDFITKNNSFQLNRAFSKIFVKPNFFLDSLAQQMSKELRQHFDGHPLSLDYMEIERFANSLPSGTIQKAFLDCIKDQKQQWVVSFYNPELKLEEAAKNELYFMLKNIEILLLQDTSLATMRAFQAFFANKSSSFSSTVEKVSDMLKTFESHPVTKDIDKRRRLANTLPPATKDEFLQLVEQGQQEWESLFYTPPKQSVNSDKILESLDENMETLLLKNGSLATMRFFEKEFVDSPKFSLLVTKISTKLKDFDNHSITQTINAISNFAVSIPNEARREAFLSFANKQQQLWEIAYYEAERNTSELERERFRQSLMQVMDAMLLNDNDAFTTMRQFQRYFSTSSTAMDPVVEKISRRISDFESHALSKSIKEMQDFATSLVVTHSKRKDIFELVGKIQQKWELMFIELQNPNYDKEKIQQIKSECVDLLKSHKDIMSTHREIWKPIIVNFAIALTGIGVLAIAGKAIYSGVKNGELSFNSCFFFAKTASQQRLEAVEEKVNATPAA